MIIVKIKRLLHLTLIFSASIFIIGCQSNPYKDFYKPNNQTALIPKVSLPKDKAPEWVSVKDLSLDTVKPYLRDGYMIVGQSGFEASEVDHNQALLHAKDVGASLVLLGKQYLRTNRSSVPLFMPNNSTSFHSGSVYGTGGSANYMGTTNTFGSSMMVMPTSHNRYDYGALYLAKIDRPPAFGAHFQDLSDAQRKAVESNKGVSLTIVNNKGGAFDADLLEGDILLTANGEVIENVKWFVTFLGKQKKGDQIELSILRDGSSLKKTVVMMNDGFKYDLK